MDYSELNDFSRAVKQAYLNANAGAPAPELINSWFERFKSFPLSLVLEAIDDHILKSEYCIKAANIYKFIQIKLGLTDEQLKLKASEFFDKYLLNPSSFYVDLVIEDWRMASAFRKAFTNFVRFASRNNSYNEFREDALRQEFTKAAIQFKFCKDPMSVPRVFEGKRNFDNKINVAFIGDYYKCKFFADQYYEPIIKEQQIIVQYPVDPNRRIENKNNGKSKELTDEERKESVKNIDDVLKELAPTIIPPYKKKK
jgi:hypothetical protein